MAENGNSYVRVPEVRSEKKIKDLKSTGWRRRQLLVRNYLRQRAISVTRSRLRKKWLLKQYGPAQRKHKPSTVELNKKS